MQILRNFALFDGDDGPLTLEEILPSLGSTNEDDEIREMIWEAIDETLSELPEVQRYVFVANEFEDMSACGTRLFLYCSTDLS